MSLAKHGAKIQHFDELCHRLVNKNSKMMKKVDNEGGRMALFGPSESPVNNGVAEHGDEASTSWRCGGKLVS